MSDSSPLRLASYNIRAGLGSDLRRDPLRVLSAISALDADVVVLQEADFRLGSRHSALPLDRIEPETGLRPLPVARNAVSLGWHGIAVLARPDLTVDQIHHYPLPGLEPRGAVSVDLPGLRVVGVHLGLLRHSRRQQLDFIRNALDALPPLPTVILGDFNEWSRKVGLGRLAQRYNIVTPGRTYPSTLPLGALDRVAHCAALDIRVLAPPRKENGRHPSDHLPILAEVHHTRRSQPGPQQQ